MHSRQLERVIQYAKKSNKINTGSKTTKKGGIRRIVFIGYTYTIADAARAYTEDLRPYEIIHPLRRLLDGLT